VRVHFQTGLINANSLTHCPDWPGAPEPQCQSSHVSVPGHDSVRAVRLVSATMGLTTSHECETPQAADERRSCGMPGRQRKSSSVSVMRVTVSGDMLHA